MMDRIDPEIAEAVMQRLADVARPLANGAGVGEVETVGHLVSYLLDHPRDIEPCLRFGIHELPDEWIEGGSLSYHGNDGKVWRPGDARRARTVKSLMTIPPDPIEG